MSLFLCKVLLTGLRHPHLTKRHVVGNTLRHLLPTKVDLGQEALGDGAEGLFWSWQEPVNDGGVRQGRELSTPLRKVLPHGREAENQVQVRSYLVNEVLPANVLVRVLGNTGRLHLVHNRTNNPLPFILVEHLWHVPATEHVI